MPGSFNSSQFNACVVGIGVLGPRFIVSSRGLGLHKMLPPRGFEPGTSRMPGKRCTIMLQLRKLYQVPGWNLSCNYILSHKKKKKNVFVHFSQKQFFCFCFWETKKFYIFSMCFGPRRSFYEKSSGVLRTKLKLLNFIDIFLLTLTQGQRSNFKVKLEIW